MERFLFNIILCNGYSLNVNYPVQLDDFRIPSSLRRQVNQGKVDVFSNFDAEVTARNHCERFSNLLHVEELQMEVDIQRFSMEKTKLGRERSYLTLEVPGLAENRPSLVRGDKLFVRKLSADGHTAEKKEYEGYVHDVGLNKVFLKFSQG